MDFMDVIGRQLEMRGPKSRLRGGRFCSKHAAANLRLFKHSLDFSAKSSYSYVSKAYSSFAKFHAGGHSDPGDLGAAQIGRFLFSAPRSTRPLHTHHLSLPVQSRKCRC